MERKSTIPGYRLPDELWQRIAPLLPKHPNTHRFGGGRPRVPDRQCMDGIYFVLRTGCQWKALDATGICSASTAHSRFQEWTKAGVFLRFWREGLVADDGHKGIAWKWLSADGCMTKAPLGGEKSGPHPTDRAKRGVKRSLLTDARGVPLGLEVAGANRNDMKLLPATLRQVPIEYPHLRSAPNLCLDKGYDFDEVRDLLRRFGFTAYIRRRGEEARDSAREAGHRARHWVVERTHSWMNRFRRLLIRWEKKPENYIGLLHFVCGVITFRFAGLFG
jgi:putative transposase